MNSSETVAVIIGLLLAGFCAFVSLRSFQGKGFLFNNAFLYASKEEQEKMEKKPHYRQSAVLFCLLSLIFAVIALSVILQNPQIELLVIPLIAGAVIYAVLSSARIEKHRKGSP